MQKYPKNATVPRDTHEHIFASWKKQLNTVKMGVWGW